MFTLLDGRNRGDRAYLLRSLLCRSGRSTAIGAGRISGDRDNRVRDLREISAGGIPRK